MRDFTDGATALQVTLTAVMLVAVVFLSGCASKGARHESSLYPSYKAYQAAQLRAPAPRPAVRGYRERSRAAQMNDEQKYAAIYDVPPRQDYLATAKPEPEALPRDEDAPAASADAGPVGYKTIVVTRGDTLYNIAWRYKTTTSALLKANNLRHGNLVVGQELRVPDRG